TAKSWKNQSLQPAPHACSGRLLPALRLRREASAFFFSSFFPSLSLSPTSSRHHRSAVYCSLRSFTTMPNEHHNEDQLRILRAMTPSQNLRAAERLYFPARQLKAAALRAQHPDWTEEAILEAVRQIFLYARS